MDWCASDDGSCLTAQPGTSSPAGAGLATCSTGGGPGGAPDSPDDPDDPSGGGYPTPEEPACNVQFDPECNQPLTAADSATIRTAIERHKRPASEFTNQAKAEQCEQLMAKFDELLASGNVFRGEFDTPTGDPLTATHVGAYAPPSQTMHFEPSALDAANRGDAAAIRNIFNTALHEAAHALKFEHSAAIWVDGHDLYAETPFNLLSLGINSCITNW